ncbi:type II toxin-antitoxin system VapC family toxin [Candidatus Cyanaurora vandensis]|uniref:type II toxin-antitoxin system tRNA(fMet)-specific endonuclease VapC n=1 Tax=Candidatus Cyanaurora vandensis TaxID=2714958 RepID=UPI00257D9938|nr:type II toxin-antitoxin system VapC family toxin [Candidatus Cyanaurora vandensis]
MFLLDTDTCIFLIKNSPIPVQHLARHVPEEIFLCAIVKAELAWGVRKSQQVAHNLNALEQFCSPFVSRAFDDVAAMEYGLIRADLQRQGTPIGPNDLFIAAIARAHDLTLITHNTREFCRVVGLKLEDWQLPVR